ncbi:hypothetical protein [Caballeronia sp. BCC1704]|uniref:hypothetical protein n=1 Tax=Caballeronia sp. BCC1704 TaxID=2676300 RepID=UPI001589390C|nr:hypothetical protein [Caballeronia sp. BCC1704]
MTASLAPAQQNLERAAIGSEHWLEGEVQRYLDSGEYDSNLTGWPGDNFAEVAQQAMQRLRTALVEETLRRARGLGSQVSVPINLNGWARDKLSPMFNGLFPAHERSVVVEALARGVVFLTPQNISFVLMKQTWPSTAWNLANLYLTSVGAPAFAQDACHIVGLSEETTCFISTLYFDDADPFADFVVHEAAHVFHNCKRSTVGLEENRRTEFLLRIDYAKRETFAYACEAYSRITSMANSVRQREDALERHANGTLPPDERVDHKEYLDILGEAVRIRNVSVTPATS